MIENKLRADELREKIVKGLELTRKRLVEKKQKEDREFVFSENGKIVFIKAKDMPLD